MALREWIRRVERAAKGEVESFSLRDGSRYYYGPMKVHKALFLHGIECLRTDSVENWPHAPEVYLKVCEARDPAAVLERFVPSDKPEWFIDFPYDREALIFERRLVPGPHEPPQDLSE